MGVWIKNVAYMLNETLFSQNNEWNPDICCEKMIELSQTDIG